MKSLAAALPDEPRWLETRAMLASRYAEVTGGETIESGFVVRVVHGAVSAVAVVGHPPAAAIAEAVAGTTELTPVIAQTSGATHVAEALRSSPQRRRRGNWTSERAILHLREESASCSLPVPAGVRLVTATESLDHLPAGLRHEITHARGFAPVAAVFIDSRPVSFCYPVWTTERFWDVSIDTLEAYRGQALGARAVSFMIDAMRQQGREPVWGALESNQPSLRLGAKLGFLPMGDIVVFSQGGWVFLSGGFEGA